MTRRFEEIAEERAVVAAHRRHTDTTRRLHNFRRLVENSQAGAGIQHAENADPIPA